MGRRRKSLKQSRTAVSPKDGVATWATATMALHDLGEQKAFAVPFGMPCAARTGGLTAVDLIILVDSSDSMADEAVPLLKLLEKIVAETREACPNDLRVVWLGIEGVWEETAVTQTCHHYLATLGVAKAQLFSRKRGTVKTQGAQEDGARAISDLATHFDWRPGAWRTILYVGDEPLEGGLPHNRADVRAANQAILTARQREVRVFCYAGTGDDTAAADDVVVAAYQRLTDATAGKTYAAPMASLQTFGDDLATLLCGGPKRSGGAIAPDPLALCFTLHWGDGETDRIESEDYEILTLVAHNPYRNVTFLNVVVTALRLRYLYEGTAVAVPRAEYIDAPLIDLTPSHMVGFGDLAPFDAAGGTRVARELVLGTFRTAPGKYQIDISYRYSVKFDQTYRDEAVLTVGLS